MSGNFKFLPLSRELVSKARNHSDPNDSEGRENLEAPSVGLALGVSTPNPQNVPETRNTLRAHSWTLFPALLAAPKPRSKGDLHSRTAPTSVWLGPFLHGKNPPPCHEPTRARHQSSSWETTAVVRAPQKDSSVASQHPSLTSCEDPSATSSWNRLEMITSRDAKSACFHGSRLKRSCDVTISCVLLGTFLAEQIISRDGCFLLIPQPGIPKKMGNLLSSCFSLILPAVKHLDVSEREREWEADWPPAVESSIAVEEAVVCRGLYRMC